MITFGCSDYHIDAFVFNMGTSRIDFTLPDKVNILYFRELAMIWARSDDEGSDENEPDSNAQSKPVQCAAGCGKDVGANYERIFKLLLLGSGTSILSGEKTYYSTWAKLSPHCLL